MYAIRSYYENVVSLGQGIVQIDNMTSERYLLGLTHPDGLDRVALNSRGNGVIAVTGKGNLVTWRLEIPHPEVSIVITSYSIHYTKLYEQLPTTGVWPRLSCPVPSGAIRAAATAWSRPARRPGVGTSCAVISNT